MNGFGKIFIASAVGVIGFLIFHCRHCLFGASPIPVLREDAWWGAGEPKKLGEAIAPFQIQIPGKIIEDLHERLDRYLRESPTPPLENQGFQYGFNTDYLKELVSYWRLKYKWPVRQKYLNTYPQYKTFINGLDMHFIMVKPSITSGKKVLPLLMLHGWPGSVREFYEIIPLLTTPVDDYDFVFQVVVPSLPGYGFSSSSAKPGLGPAEMAVVMKNLMNRLGFDKFYVQGGDWGAVIADSLGILYPDSILGIHSNFCLANTFMSNLKWLLGSFAPSFVVEEKHQHKLYPVKNILAKMLRESGYMHIQATKPDTIGAVLDDTPVGLAAYILEKFSVWTNESWIELYDGGLTKKFTMDALLDNIMIYWLSGSITTSQRLYLESFSEINQNMQRLPVLVPTACARFPNELLWQTRSMLTEKFKNLLHVSDHEDGGHFAAFEQPATLCKDVFASVVKFERYHTKRN